MVNTAEFTKRLMEVMEEHGLTASAFAEKIDVGRSSISHLISGRNKPSLEVVLKILEEFPEVEFDWLVKGKGSLEKKQPPSNESRSVDLSGVAQQKKGDPPTPYQSKKDFPKNSPEQKVEKIVFFYSDGSFEVYPGKT